MPHQRTFGLDLLRAVAIALVMYEHGYFFFDQLVDEELWRAPMLVDGVTLFFTLSGFLIGRILFDLIERGKLSTIGNLLLFWRRRWWRTVPNYLLVLSIVLFWHWSNGARIPDHWWSYYLFSQNLFQPQDKFFAEAWSLGVEEWFYVLLPIAFLICLRMRRDARTTAMWPVLLFFLAIPAILRAWKLHHGIDVPHIDAHARRMVCMRLDNIIIGATAAWLAYVRPAWWRSNRRWLAVAGVALLIAFKLQLVVRGDSTARAMLFEHNLEAIGCALLLPLLSGWNPVKPRWLVAPVQQLARLSYAMYLLNLTIVLFSVMPLLSAPFSGAVQESWRMSFLPLAVHWILTVALAFLLYHGFEKHMTAMRERKGLGSA
ncbi:MAG: acyltransferase [Flavobacteriales bacterium]|nr:MAG: acyltransferase [Flavobacteriales bacterium]